MEVLAKPPAFLLRVARALGRIAAWGVLTLLALFLVALSINAFDQRPSSTALALLNPPENRYKPDENIYVAIAGFDAPSGQSVIAVGQSRIADYNEHVDPMLRDPMAGLKALPANDPLRLKFEGSIDCCRAREPSFWENVRTNGPKIERLVSQNHELYLRYLSLLALPGYYETARPSYLAPMYAVPADARNLFLADVALRLQSPDVAETEAALGRLRQDIDTWHQMLVGEGTIVSKMIAVAFLQTDSLILSDAIGDAQFAMPQDMEEFLPRFELSDWNISSAFAAEFRVHAFMYRQTRTLFDDHWQPPDSSASGVRRALYVVLGSIEGQFFKLHATENLNAKAMTELAGLASLHPATFAANRARIGKWERDYGNVFSIRTIYNPIGRIFVAIATPVYWNYVLRPYDAAALQRLVRLSFEIRRQRIALSSVPAFMKLHPELSTHPADGRSFVWNPTSGEIAIHPIARQPADRPVCRMASRSRRFVRNSPATADCLRSARASSRARASG